MEEASKTIPSFAQSTSHCHHWQFHTPSCPLSRPSASCSYHQKHSYHHFGPPVHPFFHYVPLTDPRLHTSQCPFSQIHRHPYPCPIPSSVEALPFLQTMEEPQLVAPDYRETDSWTIALEEQNNDLDEEEEEEPIYVLTDEWMEFFAKSDAKRKSEKQQKQKKGNK